MSQLLESGGLSIGVSASTSDLPTNTQDGSCSPRDSQKSEDRQESRNQTGGSMKTEVIENKNVTGNCFPFHEAGDRNW